ncbi:MAG: beta-ketoacyl-[Bacteroidales bacterium]|nr:beta-ketoacyl-[acyl-carrier-protein] synthase family protein [Bacteroidales bacterium]MBQ6742085.1 beta-ketoacyl-[acyl-carrier-protein] synthase family protein [Bacteroidales bacterium]
MEKNERRVVITGMGIWSCLGTSLEEVKESLYNGKSGIIFAPERKEMGFESGLTAYVKQPELKGLVDRAHRVFMPEEAQYAYMATVDAMKMAKLDAEYMEKHDVGLLYGNDSSADAVVKSVDTMRNKKSTHLVGSGAIFQSMNSTVTMNLGCLFKLRGINMTISAACASGSHAIGLGSLLIKWGLQDCIVCGGAQEVNPFSIGSFDGIGAFSKREDAPEKASRPFDAQRDGLVPGGGAATVIIESYESAMRRGAPIIAEVMGYGFSANGDHISSPNVDGPRKSLLMALDQSGVSKDMIGYINAHATSTHVGDTNEAKAIYSVFGNNMPPVTSTKGQTGHEMWMAGASEVIYSILMMKNNFIAANLNYEYGDEDTGKLNIPAFRLDNHPFDLFLSNSFGFGGTNSTLVIKDWKE